jgi:hypothetical protein
MNTPGGGITLALVSLEEVHMQIIRLEVRAGIAGSGPLAQILYADKTGSRRRVEFNPQVTPMLEGIQAVRDAQEIPELMGALGELSAQATVERRKSA